MWVALRAFRYRNTSYVKGDQVPAEGWSIRKALTSTKRIQFIPDVVPEPPPVVPAKLKRADLNLYAESLGVENPAEFSNRESLLEKIYETLNPSQATDDDIPEVVVAEVEEEVEETDEDVDPFADLDDDDESEDDPERIDDDDDGGG